MEIVGKYVILLSGTYLFFIKNTVMRYFICEKEVRSFSTNILGYKREK